MGKLDLGPKATAITIFLICGTISTFGNSYLIQLTN
jgi:hypothetical protein